MPLLRPSQNPPHIQQHAMAPASTDNPSMVFSNPPPRCFFRSTIAVAGIVLGKRQRHFELSPRLRENSLLLPLTRKFLPAQILLDPQRARDPRRDLRQPPQRSLHSTGRSPGHRRHPAQPPSTLRGIHANPPNIPAHIPAPAFGSHAFAAADPSFPVSLDTAHSRRFGASMTSPLSIVRPGALVLARIPLLAAAAHTTPFPIPAAALRQKLAPVVIGKLSLSASGSALAAIRHLYNLEAGLGWPQSLHLELWRPMSTKRALAHALRGRQRLTQGFAVPTHRSCFL